MKLTLKADRLAKIPTLMMASNDPKHFDGNRYTGPTLPRTIYSYNATNGLYDVVVDEVLGVWFKTNCRRVEEPTKWHVAIMEHYGIEAPVAQSETGGV